MIMVGLLPYRRRQRAEQRDTGAKDIHPEAQLADAAFDPAVTMGSAFDTNWNMEYFHFHLRFNDKY